MGEDIKVGKIEFGGPFEPPKNLLDQLKQRKTSFEITCRESPDGKHCYHTPTGLVVGEVLYTCCHCGRSKSSDGHGPFKPR